MLQIKKKLFYIFGISFSQNIFWEELECNANVYLGTNSTTDVPSTIANETSNEKEDYCRPRPLSEAYSVPPIARPVTVLIPNLQSASISSTTTNSLAANYSIVPTPTPVINNQLPSTPTTSVTSNGLNTSFQDYMKMHVTGKYYELLHT